MTLELRPYPRYKDSRLPHLDRVPVHWAERRAKYLFQEVDERSDTGDDELLSVSHLTGITPRSQKNVTMFHAESYIGHKRCRPADLVINTMWAWMGALGVSRFEGIVSPSYAVYRRRGDNSMLSEYTDRLLRTPQYVSEYVSRSTGIRSSRLRLYPEQFLDIPIVQPPLDEQRQIESFLASMDRLSRRLIRAKRRQIELLNEQKQAIIHQAVTRGLDPDVPLKPSGVDWLGDVPAHWEIRKLKFVAEEIVGGSTPSTGAPEYWDGDIVWVTPQDVSASETLVGSKRRITQRGLEACSSTLMPAGTIVVTSRAPVGNVAFAATPLTTNQGCKAIIPKRSRLDQRYAFHLLQVLKPELQSLAKGTTFTEISTTQVANVKVPIPPVGEQRSIVASIASETQSVDQSIDVAEREIDLIREYRTRLIADVVTGKLDVRGVVLPGGDAADDAAWDEVDELDEAADVDETQDDAEDEGRLE